LAAHLLDIQSHLIPVIDPSGLFSLTINSDHQRHLSQFTDSPSPSTANSQLPIKSSINASNIKGWMITRAGIHIFQISGEIGMKFDEL
jgi:hypothetical protein